MNTLYISLIIAGVISLLTLGTRSKKDHEESNMVKFIKVMVISFVCVYFGLWYFVSPKCPEIITTEPDF